MTTIRMPNIGEFSGVEVIDVLVRSGDRVATDDPLLTLESDKATMDIPSPAVGTVRSVAVKVGDRVSEGDPILELEEAGTRQPPATAGSAAASRPAADVSIATPDSDAVDVVVLGSGPGGYTAAFRAADLGLSTVLVERHAVLGGVCLNVGCIPSKALLHVARVIAETGELREAGVDFGSFALDLDRLRAWKSQVVGKLTGGLKSMAKQRGIRVVQGSGRFTSASTLQVETAEGRESICFRQAIIAAGSQSVRLPFLPEDPRIMDSTRALQLEEIPARLLVIGGGIIGLEMAAVYAQLGSRITVVEMTGSLMIGADTDLVRPLQKRIGAMYEGILLNTRVTAVKADPSGLEVNFEGQGATSPQRFDRILVAVGRTPNGGLIGAETAGVKVDSRGFIAVDEQMRSNVPHIFAIGDITGGPMLAHRASHQGKVAAEVAAGRKSAFVARVIPSVAYTDPEVAWVGVTEAEAAMQGVRYEKAIFPWAASGRALSLGRSEGFTKLLFNPDDGRIIGAGIVGTNAGDLIAETALAVEMDCAAADIGLTIHPHPTLSETIAFAAEVYEGTVTDLYLPRRK
jgi:dihydrolipoamide dehydrogenase